MKNYILIGLIAVAVSWYIFPPLTKDRSMENIKLTLSSSSFI